MAPEAMNVPKHIFHGFAVKHAAIMNCVSQCEKAIAGEVGGNHLNVWFMHAEIIHSGKAFSYLAEATLIVNGIYFNMAVLCFILKCKVRITAGDKNCRMKLSSR